MNRALKEITFEQLLELFDTSTHADLQRLARRQDVSHLVVFENQLFGSPHLGARTAVIVGSGCSWKTLDDVLGRHLHDLPSLRQYPVSQVDLAKHRAAAAQRQRAA